MVGRGGHVPHNALVPSRKGDCSAPMGGLPRAFALWRCPATMVAMTTWDESRILALAELSLERVNVTVPDNPFGLPLDDPRNPLHTPDWRVEKTREGFTLATDGDSAKEHAQAIEVLKTLLAAGTAPVVSSGDAGRRVDVIGSPSKPGISVGEAVRKYLLTLDSSLYRTRLAVRTRQR